MSMININTLLNDATIVNFQLDCKRLTNLQTGKTYIIYQTDS